MSVRGVVLLLVIAVNTIVAFAANSATKYTFYLLVPDDRDWQSDVPMISTGGGKAGTAMDVAPGMCGWFQMVWDAGKVPNEIFVYRKNNPDDLIGMNGFWGDEAEPIPLPLKEILESFGSDKLYFIPDDSQWLDGNADNQGLFVADPGISGLCSFNLAAILYDTDESLNPLFTSEGACAGVRHGIVQQNLGSDNKPVFNTGNSNATSCAGNKTLFRTLFNYAPDTNEVQCFDMPFRRYGNDSRWGFDSDSAADLFGGYNGFFPLENTSDATVITSIGAKPCSDCRNKYKSEGPVPLTYTGDFNKYCNTYGWDNGVDCEGLFGSNNSPDVWDWSTPSWESTHNQQFCFESHATFTYSEDQEFSFRSSDDLWVFINKKLAVDNGGAHLSAPARVVLKKLNDVYGNGFLVPGQDYPLDIFFCDRRPTRSDLMIKTNMFIKQTSGLSVSGTKNSDGSVSYSICYDRSGDGSCASVALGGYGANSSIHACGNEIKNYGSLKYTIATKTGEQKAVLESGKSGWQLGGIDLSNPYSPKMNTDKIIGLAPGSYRFVMELCDNKGICEAKSRVYVNFRIKDSDSDGLDFAQTRVSDLKISVSGRNVQLYGKAGMSYAVFDMQGRIVGQGIASAMGSVVPMPHAGTYLVRINGLIHRVQVR